MQRCIISLSRSARHKAEFESGSVACNPKRARAVICKARFDTGCSTLSLLALLLLLLLHLRANQESLGQKFFVLDQGFLQDVHHCICSRCCRSRTRRRLMHLRVNPDPFHYFLLGGPAPWPKGAPTARLRSTTPRHKVRSGDQRQFPRSGVQPRSKRAC